MEVAIESQFHMGFNMRFIIDNTLGLCINTLTNELTTLTVST